MRRRVIGFLVALFLVLPSVARAVTVRDIVELSRAGLSDEILLALIEVDGTIFSLTSAQIIELRDAGVSDTVLLAMLRSGRTRAAERVEPSLASPQMTEAVDPAPPMVVVVDRPDPPRVSPAFPIVVPVPVFFPLVAVSPRATHRAAQPGLPQGFGRFLNTDFSNVGFANPVPAEPQAPAEPVYWGWGGKRRPDTWPDPGSR